MRTQQMHFKVSEEEKQEIREKAKERGVDVSTYMREKVLDDNIGCIYNRNVQLSIRRICNLFYKIETVCTDDKVITEYKEVVKELWQYLR